MRITQTMVYDRLAILNNIIKEMDLEVQNTEYALENNGYGMKLVLRKTETGGETNTILVVLLQVIYVIVNGLYLEKICHLKNIGQIIKIIQLLHKHH